MNVLQAIILGIVQGLTEFIPVSSSGHLVIVPYLLGWKIPADQAFVFDVLVQVATLTAVFAYFWKDLIAILAAWLRGIACREPFQSPLSRQGWFILLATIPAGLAGLLLKNKVEMAFNSPFMTGFFLLVTAGLLVAAEQIGKRNRAAEKMSPRDSLWIGGFQALSIFPGISRSGSTLTGGMIVNLERPAAARFSFLMSIPIMIAAGLVAMLDLIKMPNVGAMLPAFLPGFITAGIVGYFTIRWLLKFLAQRKLTVFAVYCVLLGLLVIGKSLFF